MPSHHSVADSSDSLWDSDDLNQLEPDYVEVIQFKRRPYATAYWEEFPPIRICSDSGVSESRARSAVHMWKRLGYNLGNIYWDDGSPVCRTGGVSGEIIIMLVTTETPIENNLAVTRTFYNRDNRIIRRSQIFVLGGYANKPRLLEHELGHALGWAHFNRDLHVMNSNYPDTGHDVFGVRHTDYKNIIKNFRVNSNE